MAWKTTRATFERLSQLSRLLVIHSNLAVLTTSKELLTIRLVIGCQKLVRLVINSVQ